MSLLDVYFLLWKWLKYRYHSLSNHLAHNNIGLKSTLTYVLSLSHGVCVYVHVLLAPSSVLGAWYVILLWMGA